MAAAPNLSLMLPGTPIVRPVIAGRVSSAVGTSAGQNAPTVGHDGGSSDSLSIRPRNLPAAYNVDGFRAVRCLLLADEDDRRLTELISLRSRAQRSRLAGVFERQLDESVRTSGYIDGNISDYLRPPTQSSFPAFISAW